MSLRETIESLTSLEKYFLLHQMHSTIQVEEYQLL